MATQTAEDIRRWPPRALVRKGPFLISINPDWVLNELSSERATEKKKCRPAALTLLSFPFQPPYMRAGL